MTQIELIQFIPETASYQIWHPKDFILTESKDNIVTITSQETDSNLTLSSYHADQDVTETMLTDFFNERTENYPPISELRSVITDNRIWLEREFRRDNIYWIWWTLSHSNQIIVASVNSENVLTPEDRHLYIFMLDKMEIYPAYDDDDD
jgi:hypothetical protein